MNKLELAFQELEALNNSELSNVEGGFVAIESSYAEDLSQGQDTTPKSLNGLCINLVCW